MLSDKLRVIELCVENFKRLKVAHVRPGRHAVVVAGRNKQGKTSLLDSIAAALGGKKEMATEPVRQGEKAGQIICVLGDNEPELLVKRVFTNGKTALEITTADGYVAPSPQAILDSFRSMIAFDPQAFCRMDAKKQVEALRQLVGLDFTEIDKTRKVLYDHRTATNRDAKTLDAQSSSISVPTGTPEEEVSIADLMAEQRRLQKHNEANASTRGEMAEFERAVASAEAETRETQRHITRLESELADSRECHENALKHSVIAKKDLEDHRIVVSALEDQDVASIQQQIVEAQAINSAVARLRHAKKLHADSLAKGEDADAMTKEMEAIDAEKACLLAEAKWPVDGLSFGDSGVLLNGLPFSQASGAEQLTASFAISAAQNPKLRIAIIRDASLLDEDQKAVVVRLAEQYDTQVWLEMVAGAPGDCSIFLEDGEVVETVAEEVAQPAVMPPPAGFNRQ